MTEIILGILLFIAVICIIVIRKKLSEINNSLEEANLKLSTDAKARTKFLANVNYEIRTPLNAIVGFSSIIANSKNDDNDYSEIIKASNEQLINTINNIIDLSDIESGFTKITLEEINLHDVFMNISEQYKGLMHSNILFECNGSCKACNIRSNEKRISQILDIFINNAVRFTNEGKISVGYNSDENDDIKLFVSDTGRGMSAEKQKELQNIFNSLSPDELVGGVELSLANAIARKLGCSIGFTSNDGIGSTFWLKIPASKKIQSGEKKASTSSSDRLKIINDDENSNSSPLRLLVAEDIDSNYRLVEILLKGHIVERAENGLIALEKARLNEYDMILMDLRMPEMDGVEATRQIRRFDQEIPIIAITANAFDTDRDMAMKAGCDVFLTKPLSRKQLRPYIPLFE
ncbi:MAG: response regulator [Muribaculaceae bacterium]|nr:response regulator [Muribaculaceae bacterium]